MKKTVLVMIETTKATWSAEDQDELEKLLVKRHAAMDGIKNLVEFIDLQNIGSSEGIAELMVAHAAEICAALAPFAAK